jgi:hypothetical protein
MSSLAARLGFVPAGLAVALLARECGDVYTKIYTVAKYAAYVRGEKDLSAAAAPARGSARALAPPAAGAAAGALTLLAARAALERVLLARVTPAARGRLFDALEKHAVAASATKSAARRALASAAARRAPPPPPPPLPPPAGGAAVAGSRVGAHRTGNGDASNLARARPRARPGAHVAGAGRAVGRVRGAAGARAGRNLVSVCAPRTAATCRWRRRPRTLADSAPSFRAPLTIRRLAPPRAAPRVGASASG